MSDSEFAKAHLREHLSELLVPHISEGFWSISSSAKDLCERNNTPDQILRTFQNMLTKIPEWSENTLSTEVERIQKVTRCGYLDDLLMGVFIAYMKSFASLHYRGGSSEIKVEFDRPSLAKFIHELYKHSARKLWQTAYFFKTVGVSSEQQARNRQEVESTISKCLEEVIRSFLPWEAIAKKYFSDPTPVDPIQEVEDDSESEEEEESPKKTVSFGDDEEEEEDRPKMLLSDETATLDLPEEEEKVVEPATAAEQEEVDPLEELTRKAEETLVLNM